MSIRKDRPKCTNPAMQDLYDRMFPNIWEDEKEMTDRIFNFLKDEIFNETEFTQWDLVDAGKMLSNLASQIPNDEISNLFSTLKIVDSQVKFTGNDPTLENFENLLIQFSEFKKPEKVKIFFPRRA